MIRKRQPLITIMQLINMDQSRNMANRLKKAQDELRRLTRENARRELEVSMIRCIAGEISLEDIISSLPDTADTSFAINDILEDIKARMEAMSGQRQAAPPALAAPIPKPYVFNNRSSM